MTYLKAFPPNPSVTVICAMALSLGSSQASTDVPQLFVPTLRLVDEDTWTFAMLGLPQRPQLAASLALLPTSTSMQWRFNAPRTVLGCKWPPCELVALVLPSLHSAASGFATGTQGFLPRYLLWDVSLTDHIWSFGRSLEGSVLSFLWTSPLVHLVSFTRDLRGTQAAPSKKRSSAKDVLPNVLAVPLACSVIGSLFCAFVPTGFRSLFSWHLRYWLGFYCKSPILNVWLRFSFCRTSIQTIDRHEHVT